MVWRYDIELCSMHNSQRRIWLALEDVRVKKKLFYHVEILQLLEFQSYGPILGTMCVLIRMPGSSSFEMWSWNSIIFLNRWRFSHNFGPLFAEDACRFESVKPTVTILVCYWLCIFNWHVYVIYMMRYWCAL